MGCRRVWRLDGVPLGLGMGASDADGAAPFLFFLGRLGSLSSPEPSSAGLSCEVEWVMRAMATSDGVSKVLAAMASEVKSLRVRQLYAGLILEVMFLAHASVFL